MNCVKISDFLDLNNIKTPRNKINNHKIVWGSIKKYKKRLERYNSDLIESFKLLGFTVRNHNTNSFNQVLASFMSLCKMK